MRKAGQEKRLRLILVLRATNVESGSAESLTATLIEKVFTLGMMPCNGSLRCSMIASKGGEGLFWFKDGSSSLCQFD